ncbi:MAG: DUF6912 family protein [Janthinobacterium lividum]
MRVYWPTTLSALAEAVASGLICSAPVTVHAVTATLRDFYADADPRELDEELEYVAMTDAAEQSVRRLAGPDGVDTPPRRVVLALDVADPAGPPARPAGWAAPDRSQVELPYDLRIEDLVSVHVDAEEAEAEVRAAVVALPGADAGEEAARFTVEACEGHDLLWYDATEIPLLLAVES